MFVQKYGRRKTNFGKPSRGEISSPESEPGRKGSKSWAPTKIGRYHMYGDMYYDLRHACLLLLYEILFSAGQIGH